VTASNSLLLAREPARAWSVAALGAGVVAAVADATVLVADPGDLADLNWPLLLLPLVLVPMPVAWPYPAVRVAAAAAMAGWCVVGTFSVGPFFLPCLLLMIVAAARSFR